MATDPSLLNQATPYDRHSVLHVAAASGQIEVSFGGFLRDLAGIFSPDSIFLTCAFLILQILSLLLERFTNPDTLNRHKQVNDDI